MRVQVFTVPIPYVAGRDAPLAAKVINWNDSSDRKWFMNHLHWSMTNGHATTISPESN